MTGTEKNWILTFLGKAKRSAYADDTVIPTRAGHATTYKYINPRYEDLIYTDCYIGTEMFTGSEVVTRQGFPVFSMSYSGIEFIPFDMCPDAVEVLKEALKMGPIEDPWYIRGCNGIVKRGIQYSVKYNQISNLYTSGTEFIYETDKILDYCEKKNINYMMENHVDIINRILAEEKDFPKWLLFKCDFQGGFLKGVL